MVKAECFVISPIGPEGSETRERSDKVRDYVVEPPFDDRGYDIIRSDEISEPGEITNQVIEHLLDCDFVVADLTDSNPNVFYELAIRHAAGEPVITIAKGAEDLPFDVKDTRTIMYDLKDVEDVEETKDEIGRQIDEIEGEDFEVDNPVKNAVNIKELRSGGGTVEEEIADLREEVSEIRRSFSEFGHDVRDLGHVLRKLKSRLVPKMSGDTRSTHLKTNLEPDVEERLRHLQKRRADLEVDLDRARSHGLEEKADSIRERISDVQKQIDELQGRHGE